MPYRIVYKSLAQIEIAEAYAWYANPQINMGDAVDRRAFAGEGAVDVRWVASDAELIAAVQAWALPAGDGYAWCAGEAATMAAVRHELVGVKGLGKHTIRAAAYWKRGGSGYHENLE